MLGRKVGSTASSERAGSAATNRALTPKASRQPRLSRDDRTLGLLLQDCDVIVEQIDVNDDEAFAAWFAPIYAVDIFDRPDDPGWRPAELRAMASDTSSFLPLATVVRDDSGVVAGSALAGLPTRDSLDLVDIWGLAVHPDHRRRGYGRALLTHLQQVALQRDRARLVAYTEIPIGNAERVEGEAFAAAMGFERAVPSGRRCLRLPVSSDRIEELESAAGPHAADDYEIIAWTGGCPEAWVEGRVGLARGMSTDAPHGELDAEPEQWDVPRLRAFEQLVASQDRVVYATGAVHKRSGELVGYSDIGIPRTAPEVGYQFDTIVGGQHRGHRLGTLLKVANLREIMCHSPDTNRIFTWNADENEPMIRVNDELGFERVGNGSVWQKHLA